MTKPFGSTVAQCLRRVDQMANLLNYFPPMSTRDELPDMEVWNLAIDTCDVGHLMNRKIKFNLLPTKFQNTLEEEVDED